MPPAFIDWQCAERRTVFEAIERGEVPRSFAAHLPVVSTLNEEGAAFPIHSATKGVGLIPKQEFLAEHVGAIESCLARCAGKPPQESLAERIETARALYGHRDRIERRSVGAIEIFCGSTYRNLVRDGRAALLFTGAGPSYMSHQLNCLAEIVGPDDPYARFIRGMRFLFEVERFHIQQPEYPHCYLLHVREAFDKTPRIRSAGRCMRAEGGSS